MIHGPNSPDKPSRDEISKAMIGRDDWLEAGKYPLIITYVLCAIIGVAVIAHAFALLRECFPRWWNWSQRKSILCSRITAMRRGIVYYTPPKVGIFQIPQMGTTIVIASFCIGVIAWTFSIRPFYRLTREWGSPPLAVRAGMMGAGLVPFVVCTALKVNPISLLTGYSHEKLQVFHQWLGRLFLFLSIVHTLPFIIQPSIEGGASNLHAYYVSDHIYWSGTAALILLVWIVCTGTGFVRRMSYEFFVVQHIVTSIGLLVCLLLHFEQILNSHLWVWTAVALWSFSTTVRTFMAIFSSEFVFAKRTQIEVQQLQNSAYGALNSNEQRDSQLVKLTMSMPIHWKPGQHVYMRFPTINPLENHPFTIASLPDPIPNVDSRLEVYVRVFGGITHKLYKRASHSSQTAADCCEEKKAETTSKMSHSTGSNLSDNVQFTTESTKIMALVDGPYGRSTDPAIFECALFVAGGSGVTFALPVLNDLLRRVRAGKRVVTKRIHFIWAARSLSAYILTRRNQLDV